MLKTQTQTQIYENTADIDRCLNRGLKILTLYFKKYVLCFPGKQHLFLKNVDKQLLEIFIFKIYIELQVVKMGCKVTSFEDMGQSSHGSILFLCHLVGICVTRVFGILFSFPRASNSLVRQ